MLLPRQQFRKTLTQVDWMDEKTRKAALEKADSMASHIAYPNEMLDDDKLTQFYSGVCVLLITVYDMFSTPRCM